MLTCQYSNSIRVVILGHHRYNTTFQILYSSSAALLFSALRSVADTIERKPRQRSVLPVTWNWATAAILQTDVRIPRPMCCDVIRHHEDWGTIRSQTLRDSPLTSCKVSRRRDGENENSSLDMRTRRCHSCLPLIRLNQWCNALLWLDTVSMPSTVECQCFFQHLAWRNLTSRFCKEN